VKYPDLPDVSPRGGVTARHVLVAHHGFATGGAGDP
jgi:hypothetical protein